jgi:hypothetical protein
MSGGSLDHFLPWPSTRSESFAPIPVCWPTLDGTEAHARLEELADWISWLLQRYTLDYRTIPPCWASHGALVEELSALRTGWLTAYAQDARGDAPLHWHTDFAAARQRLTDCTARTGCRPAEHRSAHT